MLNNFISINALPFQIPGVAESHIDANVPDKTEFDRLLNRDLTEYFNQYLKKPVTVQHELLRNVPTQVGVALPKYYLWVKVYQADKLIEEGAMRVAAEEKRHFEVLQYFTTTEINANSEKIYAIFPKDISEKIIDRVHAKK